MFKPFIAVSLGSVLGLMTGTVFSSSSQLAAQTLSQESNRPSNEVQASADPQPSDEVQPAVRRSDATRPPMPPEDPVGTSIVYQGELQDTGGPVTGSTDLQFRLYDKAAAGGQIGPALQWLGAMLVDGRFTVELDFGAGAFNAEARWLEIDVWDAGAGSYVTLSPRQAIMAAPVAQFALNGNEGPQGVQGIEGPIGPIGPDGPQGPQGDEGPQGIEGPIGPDGPQGAKGEPGVKGDPGAKGDPGVQGIQGEKGIQGDPGLQGIQGVQGLQGDPGIQGLQGPIGPEGPQGPQGTAGDSHWSINGSATYYTAGNVGIGVDQPFYPLEVETNSGSAIVATTSASSVGTSAIVGIASAGTSATKSIYGINSSSQGTGVHGRANSNTGTNYGVYGETSSDDGYAGYFKGGRNYFEGKVGVGREADTYALEVESNKIGGILGNNVNSDHWSTAVRGISSAGTGMTYGGRFSTASTTGRGVLGLASATTGFTYGGMFHSDSVNGVGVYGSNTTLTGDNYGGFFRSNSTTGNGVYAWASSATGTNYGLYAKTDSSDGYAGYFEGGRNYFEGRVGVGREAGSYTLEVESNTIGGILSNNVNSDHWSTAVHGISSAGTGITFGGRFSTESTEGRGVFGLASAATGFTYGGRFQSDSVSGVGVYGSNTSTTGKTYGSFFRSYSTDGNGVYGWASSATGTNYGVRAKTNSPNGYAGYFEGGKNYFEGRVGIGETAPKYPLVVTNTGSTFYTVYASTSGDTCIHGAADATVATSVGGSFSSRGESGRGVYGVAESYTGVNYGVFGKTNSLDGFSGYFEGGRSYFQGKVGVGAFSPAAKLQVDAETGEEALRVRIANSTKLYVAPNGYTAIGSYSTPLYQLQVYGAGTAGKPGGGSWTSSSDRRLKKNIADLDGSLEQLLKLRGVTYEYIDPDAINELHGTRVGMIAQEVEEVFPDWIADGGHGYKTLTIRGFEALAVEALRELRQEKDNEMAEIKENSRKKDLQIATLGREVESLHSRLEELEIFVAQFAASQGIER